MKNIFILLLSVITMSMFTFASCEGDEPQPISETGFDTFRYETSGVGEYEIVYIDSTNSNVIVTCSGGDWHREFKVQKPYRIQMLSITASGNECKIIMNGVDLNVAPNNNMQYVRHSYGELWDLPKQE